MRTKLNQCPGVLQGRVLQLSAFGHEWFDAEGGQDVGGQQRVHVGLAGGSVTG